MDGHSYGRHWRAGLHCRRSVSRRRSAKRSGGDDAPGHDLTILEPLYEGGIDGVTPGSSCIANAYTSNHELLASKDVGFFRRIILHAVDAVGLVHAMLLRIQAVMLPIQTLVLSGH